VSGQRRRPKRTRTPSDVFRHRGGAAAALAAAVLVVAGVFATSGSAALAPRGPVALPHAALECAACHVDTARAAAAGAALGAVRMSAACSGCHGEHSSRRNAHRVLSARGALACSACHAVHDAEDGLRLSAAAPAVHYGTGFARELAEQSPRGLDSVQFVPLVARARCAACHEPNAVTDPASSCFTPANPDYNLCFDEHRAPAEARRGAARGRDVATEAARAMVLAGAARAEPSGLRRSGLVLMASLASVFVLAWVVRSRKKPARRRATTPSAPPAAGTRRLPQIDALRCLGCHACVDACPYDVLEVERYVARVARPDDCCGLLTCERACPNGSLVVLAAKAPAAVPAIRESLELSARPGLYLAGDATGSSLIRNAVRQGASVARHARDELRVREPSHVAEVDLAIVGAGPAGLSAGLEAQALGLRAVVLEQATIAESIRRFSRGKLVLDADADSEERLPLFVGETHKEELLARWLRSVRAARVDVRENARVTAVHGEKGAFRVEIERGHAATITARRVLIAVGRRGTPRKLEAAIPELAEARVHYELSDAQAFAGQRVVIAGLGDVAMEAALALAAQPGTDVSVLARGRGFRRGKRRNIDALSALVARGRVRLEFESEIIAVGVRSLDVQVRDSRRSLDYDALFVLIGALPAVELLEAFGVPAARD
jgi:thioredoxin reductase/NAD-dependent dihydropyrimidine dehydrogenase PreA subunit